MTLLLPLFSIFVYALAFVWMLLAILVSLPFLPFVPFYRIQAQLPARMLGWLPWFAFCPIRIRYHARFDRQRPSLYCANHVSALDPYVILAAIPVPFCAVVADFHLRVPVYGWLMRMSRAISVHLDRAGASAEVTAQVKDRVARGISICVMPEAHRTLDGKMIPFRRGAFFMARDAGLPVVPIAIRGLYRILPKGNWVLRPGFIEVQVGPQIETAGLTDEEVGALAERCHGWIAAYAERGEILPAEALGPALPTAKE